ncbi:SOS regulatory protein LexA [Xenococcus sp. PCC 7305]|uniref:transcriptional repressor LexA n=1 Tax=Xenococcus sp. PCC 7305 TaxID=102125 RepID=UPI0002AC0497|nr:transcriptional repressor LexA [Xenococcus sp. PCC 7305]ELS04750.1 SOS regulatory protein LexA [Xenococcus sp. PCC 7305]
MERLTPAQKELYDWLVDYIQTSHHAPSIRQMMIAMNLRSPAPIQSRLERLRNKGYIDWTDGKARTMRIVHQPEKGLPILGAIAAEGSVEKFMESAERLDLSDLWAKSEYYVLRVTGDSMIEDFIIEGDLVVMREVSSVDEAQSNDIVAAKVPGQETSLQRFYIKDNKVTLQPANARYKSIEIDANSLELQGVLVGIWRTIENNS